MSDLVHYPKEKNNLIGESVKLIDNSFKLITLEKLGRSAFSVVNKVYDLLTVKFFSVKRLIFR